MWMPRLNLIWYHYLVQCHGMLGCSKPLKIALHLRMQVPIPTFSSQNLNVGHLSHWCCSLLWPIKAAPCCPSKFAWHNNPIGIRCFPFSFSSKMAIHIWVTSVIKKDRLGINILHSSIRPWGQIHKITRIWNMGGKTRDDLTWSESISLRDCPPCTL